VIVTEVTSVTARFPRSPGASDVGLLVEIADTSLAEDRKMAQTYAARGIPVCLIVNLVDRQLDPRLPMSWTLRANPGDTGPLWHRPRTTAAAAFPISCPDCPRIAIYKAIRRS
jgi:hypothetical protein